MVRKSLGVLLSQKKKKKKKCYILDILNRTKMLEAKPVNSTIAIHTSTPLSDIEGDRFDDVNFMHKHY